MSVVWLGVEPTGVRAEVVDAIDSTGSRQAADAVLTLLAWAVVDEFAARQQPLLLGRPPDLQLP